MDASYITYFMDYLLQHAHFCKHCSSQASFTKDLEKEKVF